VEEEEDGKLTTNTINISASPGEYFSSSGSLSFHLSACQAFLWNAASSHNSAPPVRCS